MCKWELRSNFSQIHQDMLLKGATTWHSHSQRDVVRFIFALIIPTPRFVASCVIHVCIFVQPAQHGWFQEEDEII